MPSHPEKAAFIEAVASSLSAGTFLKLTLGKYRGDGAERRVSGTRILLKDVPHLKLVTVQGTQETTENVAPQRVADTLAGRIGTEYLSATLFATDADLSIVYSRKRVPKLISGRPTLGVAPPETHDRAKDYLVDVAAPWLRLLGVTHGGEAGRPVAVKPSMYAKFRQICRFVEILDGLVAASPLKDAPAPRIVDIGAGKGYLTFALHDHLVRRRGMAPVTVGIEANAALAAASNAIARQCAMPGMTFEATLAEQHASGAVDILIALHACDTATDDAILAGLDGAASLIVTAPCCQHEVAPQLASRGHASPLGGLLKFGLLRQRQADLVTDAIRALVLEREGYEVKVIEFVATEHTAKNLMLAAVRSGTTNRAAAEAALDQLLALTGVRQQRLLNRRPRSGAKGGTRQAPRA